MSSTNIANICSLNIAYLIFFVRLIIIQSKCFFFNQDPAIRRAVSSTPANRGLEDYNPFAEQGSQGTAQVRGASNPPIYGGLGATQQPATLQPSNQEPPATNYARTPQQTVNTALGSTISPTSDVNIYIYTYITYFIIFCIGF